MSGPHARTADDVVAAVASHARDGLDPDEAVRRLAQDGPNELARSAAPSLLQRIMNEFRDPLVILLVVAVVISFVAWVLEGGDGLPYDSIAITVILCVNAGIGAAQARRADNAAAALERLSATHARVIRGGSVQRVPTSEVVVGDVVVLQAGDAVPADARVLTAHSLQTAEAALTGESHPVDKTTQPVDEHAFLGERAAMVFSGTAIVAGRGTAVVVATGMGTEVGGIASMLRETQRLTTPLQREIAGLGRLLGSLVVAVAIVVMGVLVATTDVESVSDVIDILLVGVSLAVAAVPEGLPAVLSVVLAIGVQRMAARNALVKRLASAETLGAATVICSDKTGTLTRSEMTVRVAVVGSSRIDIDGVGYEPVGAITAQGHAPDAHDRLGVERLLGAAVVAGDSDIEQTPEGWVAVGNPTEAALVAAAGKLDGPTSAQPAVRRLAELAFSSDRKRMSVLVEAAGGERRMITKGAPDVLIDRCTTEATPSGPVPLSAERRQWWQAQVAVLAGEGLRTLAVARRADVAEPLVEADETALEWLGMLGIDDPPRAEVEASVRAAHDSGIRVVMITGDHPATAARIAQLVGIGDDAPDGDEVRVVTGADLDAVTDDELVPLAASTSVFARVTPAHKLRLVRALQASGEVVAMTGDGVNDAPALKAADLGTAMGRTGTDVAREASDMILLDDNFATIVAAVSEGRTIWHNIRSFLRYLLSSNVGEVFTVFGGIVLAGVIGLGDGVLAPLTASQILWINLLTDAAPALALGMDPVDPSVMRRPPRPRTERIVDRRMQRGIAVVGVTMAVVTLLMFDLVAAGGLVDGDGSIDDARTAAFTVLVFAQIFNAFSARSDVVSARHTWSSNRLLLWAAALSVVLQIGVVHLPPLNDAFSTTPLSAADWVACVALASAVLWVAEIRKWLLRRTQGSDYSRNTKNPA